jgi:hypothetical protein
VARTRAAGECADRRAFRSSNESNYRTSAYEAITSFISNSPQDTIAVVQNTSVTILARMEHLLSVQNQIVGTDDRNNWNDLQSNFCSVIIVSAAGRLCDRRFLTVGCRARSASWGSASSPWRSGS